MFSSQPASGRGWVCSLPSSSGCDPALQLSLSGGEGCQHLCAPLAMLLAAFLLCWQPLLVDARHKALPSLPAAALCSLGPAARAAPCLLPACSCCSTGGCSGVGSADAEDLPLLVPASQVLYEPHSPGALLSLCQRLSTAVLCLWPWQPCCWWGTVALVSVLPGLPAGSLLSQGRLRERTSLGEKQQHCCLQLCLCSEHPWLPRKEG